MISARYCLFCGEPLLDKVASTRVYCSTKCRRDYQNERRREERAELAEIRRAEKNRPMMDPWSRNDLEDYTVEEIMELAWTMDPAPDMYETPMDRLRKIVDAMKDRELAKPAKLRQCWLV